MLYHWLIALSFLILVLLADFTTVAINWNEINWDDMLVKHTWNDIPANWESLGNATAGAMIKLHIALKSEREGALIDTLYEVSNPEHPKYGAYLSKEQLAELVSPHPDTLDLVRAWLAHHGIRPSSISTTHGGSWLTVTDVLVSQANQLLGAAYQIYRNSKTNDTTIRTVGYALPTVLHSHIQTVAPTTYFPSMRGMRQTPRRHSLRAAPVQAEEAPGNGVTARQLPGLTPEVLRWLYGAGFYYPGAVPKNKFGVLGIYDEYPSKLDLNEFTSRYRTEERDATFTVEPINGGGYNPDHPGDVANLGIQYAAALTYPGSTLVFYSVGGHTEWDSNGRVLAGDMYLVWINKLLVDPSPPRTLIIGYGEPEKNLPFGYANEICRLYARLGSRGVSILVASGIDGVGEGECVNRGMYRFIPEFPSSCPYVTSVGGTTNFRPEIAANLSGGGFSFYFDTPGYQQVAVEKYLDLYPRVYDGFYNRNGRGYPDISAQALDHQYIFNGEMFYMNGTICSVSTAASMVSLMNARLISRDQTPLGFLNPKLYSLLFRVNDIVNGSNPGCGTDGFVADTGWDPATGLGTLEFTPL